MRKLTIVLASVSCCFQPRAIAQTTFDQLGRESLRGLRGVYLFVNVGSTSTPEMRSLQHLFQTEVEVQLRQAGIRLLTEEEWNIEPGKPWLVVIATVYDVHVEFRQQVQLTRNPSIMTVGETWRTAGEVVLNKPDMLSALHKTVGEQLMMFVNAFLAANPR